MLPFSNLDTVLKGSQAFHARRGCALKGNEKERKEEEEEKGKRFST